jgi:HEAT repeat protein
MRATVAIIAIALAACGGGPSQLTRAETLMSRGDYAGAERAADSGIETAPKDAALWRLKIDAVQRQGDHARAVELYLAWHQLIRRYDNRMIRQLAAGALRAGAGDAEPSVRARALAVIDRFDPPGLGGVVAQHLDDPAPPVRARAAAALYDGDDRARAVIERMARGGHPAARAIAIRRMARAGAGRSLAIAALADPTPAVRRAAIAAVDRLGGDGRVTRLIAAAGDADGSVRADALAALAGEDDRRLVDVALGALDDDYLGARLAAIRVLAGDGERGRSALAGLVDSADAYVALRAAVALRKAGVAVPADAVRRALADRRWNVRVAALNAVAEVTEPDEALRLIGPALIDDRVEVRLAAARVMARLGATGRASQTFYTALEGPREQARLQAAVALLRMGDSGGLDALGELLASRDAGIRAGAAFALQQTDNVSLQLVRALGDSDAGVRIAAAESLLWLTREKPRKNVLW